MLTKIRDIDIDGVFAYVWYVFVCASACVCVRERWRERICGWARSQPISSLPFYETKRHNFVQSKIHLSISISFTVAAAAAATTANIHIYLSEVEKKFMAWKFRCTHTHIMFMHVYNLSIIIRKMLY